MDRTGGGPAASTTGRPRRGGNRPTWNRALCHLRRQPPPEWGRTSHREGLFDEQLADPAGIGDEPFQCIPPRVQERQTPAGAGMNPEQGRDL